MAIVMLSEAQDCDEPERVLSNRRNLSPIASCSRFVADPFPTLTEACTAQVVHGCGKTESYVHSAVYLCVIRLHCEEKEPGQRERKSSRRPRYFGVSG